MDQNSQNIVLIKFKNHLANLNSNAVLRSLHNLLQDAYIIFQKDVDNFEIEYRTANYGGCMQYSLKTFKNYILYVPVELWLHLVEQSAPAW